MKFKNIRHFAQPLSIYPMTCLGISELAPFYFYTENHPQKVSFMETKVWAEEEQQVPAELLWPGCMKSMATLDDWYDR